MLLSQAAYWCQFYFNNISLDLQIVSGLLRCYFANLQRCCCTIRPCTTTPETVKMFSVFCRLSVAIRHAVFLLFQTCPAAFVWTPYLHYKFEETVTFAYPVIAFSSVGYQIFIFTVPVSVCATAFSVRDEMMGWKVTLAQHCILTCLTRTTHRKLHMFDLRSKASSILRKGFRPCSRADACTVSIYAAWKRKKAHSLIVHWTNFSFDDSMRSLWHHFYKLVQCHSIYFQSCIHVLPSSCVDSGGVGPLPNVFSSTS